METIVAQWRQFDDEEKHVKLRFQDLRGKKRKLEAEMTRILANTPDKRCIVNGLFITLIPGKKREAPQSLQKKLETTLSATGEMKAKTIEGVLKTLTPSSMSKEKLKIMEYKLK